MGKNFYPDACTIRCRLRRPLGVPLGKIDLSIERLATPYNDPLPVSFSYLEPVVEDGHGFWLLHEFYFCKYSEDCSSLISDIRSRSSFDWSARIDAALCLYGRKFDLDGEVLYGSSES